MWTETILVVWGHGTPGVEERSCRRGSGGVSETRLDAVVTARPALETRKLVGGCTDAPADSGSGTPFLASVLPP